MKKIKKTLFVFCCIFATCVSGCSKHSETKSESVLHSENKKSVKESLAEDLLAEFQGDLDSWNACIVYDGKEYTSLDDFLNRDK